MKREAIDESWDMVVIGGGITGAGVLRRAAASGYKVLLVEQKDFAWGTSSRSGKLVHGGLRYVAQGQLRTAYHSVREREQLLKALPGLVDLIDFAFPNPGGTAPPQWAIKLLFLIWDAMAGRTNHRYLPKDQMRDLVAGLNTRDRSGFVYGDGSTDDARLVLRILQQGVDFGGTARNYTRVNGFGRTQDGQIHTVQLEDTESGHTFEVRTKVVVNATGAWVDEIRAKMGQAPIIRRLRGSHIIFPQSKLPMACAAIFPAKGERRGLYAVPWQGVTLVGTTDLDHHGGLAQEPYMTTIEGEYLLAGIRDAFPDLNLQASDILCSQAGVRPVIGSGKKDPSKEARDAKVLTDANLISVSGGKLTTFDFMARRVMRRTGPWLPEPKKIDSLIPAGANDKKLPQQLTGRFGRRAVEILQGVQGLQSIENTSFSWAEARWSAENEQVMHLDDLMLRRTRLGLVLPQGGLSCIEQMQKEVGPALGWSSEKWTQEIQRYEDIWNRAYSPRRIDGAPEKRKDDAPKLAAAG